MNFLKLFIPPILLIFFKKIGIKLSKSKNERVFPELTKINSYSQSYEDLIIDAILNKKIGFYVDVGANDPDHLSNTKRFYDKGWSGINVEPQIGKIKDFERSRERDVNVNYGIAEANGELNFYELAISTLSSFNYQEACRNCKKFNTKISTIRKVGVRRLDSLFEEFLPKGVQIDFLSIDTEGFEMEVLKSNDWSKFRPVLIVIEFGSNLYEIHSFLIDVKYSLVFKNSYNLIYKSFE